MEKYRFHIVLIITFCVIVTNPIGLSSKLELFYILIHELSHFIASGFAFAPIGKMQIIESANGAGATGYSYGYTHAVVYISGFLGTPVFMNLLLQIKRRFTSRTALFLLGMYVLGITLAIGNSTALFIASACSSIALTVSVSKWTFDFKSDLVLYFIYATVNIYNLTYLVEIALGQRSSLDISALSKMTGILNGSQLAFIFAIVSLLLLFMGILIDSIPHSNQDGAFFLIG